MKVETKKVKISEINPNPDNPRNITKEDMERLVKSLQEFPEMLELREIVVDETMTVLGGNMRLRGLQQVGITDCIAKIVTGLTSEQKREFVIKDNGSWGQFDFDLLANQWDDLPLAEWGVDLPEAWLADPDPESSQDAEPQIDKAGELNKVWQVKPEDLFQIGEHRLLCRDSTKAEDVERVMGGERAQGVVTDPPYGINREGIENDDPKKLATLFEGCLNALPAEDAVIISFQSPRLFHIWFDACRNHKIKFERLLWMHRKTGKAFPWRGWVLVGDPIQVSSIGRAEWGDPVKHEFDCYIKEVLEDRCLDGLHTTIKPLDIISDLISHTVGIVYDPFLGSGTTMVACQNLNRKCRGIEILAPYVAVCLERMKTAFPEIEIKRIE